MLLDVDPDSFVDAARRASRVAAQVSSARTALLAGLGPCAAAAGTDPADRDWARSYDDAAAAAVRLADAAVEACGHLTSGLSITGLNYATAEHLNNGRTGNAPGFTLPSPPAPECSPAPPSAAGSASPPTLPGLDLVIGLIGSLWPDGSPSRLRSVATAWSSFAGALSTVSLDTVMRALAGETTPEQPAIREKVSTAGESLRSLEAEARAIAESCRSFARHIDDVHGQTLTVLRELGDQVGLTVAVGLALTVVTAGGSDLVAGGAAGAEVGAAATRILGFIRTMTPLVARSTDELALTATSLGKATGFASQITVRLVPIAGRTVNTAVSGAVANVAYGAVADPSSLTDSDVVVSEALMGAATGAGLSVGGAAARAAGSAVADAEIRASQITALRHEISLWSSAKTVAGYEPYGDLSKRKWFRSYFGGLTTAGYPDWRWPIENGFNGPMSVVASPNTLRVGETIERISPASRDGSFASRPGTPFPLLSLPPDRLSSAFVRTRYVVVRPLPPDILEGPIAPSFGQPGGGVQYYFPNQLQESIDLGYLKEVP